MSQPQEQRPKKEEKLEILRNFHRRGLRRTVHDKDNPTEEHRENNRKEADYNAWSLF